MSRGRALLLLAILFGSLVFLFYSPYPSFSMFNERWNGCSELVGLISDRGGRAKVLPSIETLNTTGSFVGRVLLVLSPVEEFSKDEARVVSRFIEHGGGLLLADDFRQGSSLGKFFGVVFSKELFLEPSSYSKRPSFPIVNLSSSDLPGPAEIMLNYPSTLQFSGRLRAGEYLVDLDGEALRCKLWVLARSSQVSWLDSNVNFEKDEGEPRASFPLIALLECGKGRVIIISDPDLFINGMISRADNLKAISYLLDCVSRDNSSAAFYFAEQRVWRVKPVYTYLLTIIGRWGTAPLFSRLILSAVAGGLFLILLLYGFSRVLGAPFLESIFNAFGAARESEEEAEWEGTREVWEGWDYHDYLIPIFERILTSLGEGLGFEGIPPDPSSVVEAARSRYPALDFRKLKRLLTTYREINDGQRAISDFKTFSKAFDELMDVARALSVEW